MAPLLLVPFCLCEQQQEPSMRTPVRHSLVRHSLALGLSTLLLAPAVHATPVIFDTDMAIDDWAALLFLVLHPEVELKAVTVSASGEAHCNAGVPNAQALLTLADPATTVPVACGDAWPMDGYFVFPQPWRVDSDTLYGVPVPAVNGNNATAYSGHAVELIHASLTQSTEPVVLLAVGPLTNIAQWLQTYPADRAKVSRVVVMGGSLIRPGNIPVAGFTDGHPNKRAEWNLFVDPLAADIVFQSGLPVEMVGLDVTNTVHVTAEFAKAFKQVAQSPAARFWDTVLDKNDWFIASGDYYLWDVLAALTLVDRARFCSGEQMALHVLHEPTAQPYLPSTDASMPTLLVSGVARRHFDAATAGVVERGGEGSVLVCQRTNGDAAFEVFTSTMTAQ
jgi:inosine-uridine nucleoside N-ribohydrolase